MIKAYVDYWKGYVDFSGKTSVGGYWWAWLANFIISAIISAIATALKLDVLATIWSIATLLPGLAISVRRLKDAGYKWYNLLWVLVPLVGWIILIVLLVKPTK